VRVETITLDDFVKRNGLPKVDFLKMDIEGAEFAALNGAANTIRLHRPKLAISLYHSLEDFIRIPLLIKRIVPEYRLYIGHHTVHAEETVLYAVAE
jgi:hypothetical protein